MHHQSQAPLDPQESPKRPLDFPTQSSKPFKVSKPESDDEQKFEEEEKEIMNKNPGVQRYLIAVEYFGTRFSGAQKQSNCRTVVGVLEEAFLKFIGQPVSIICSSRTDAGVHALSNVCHVDVERISKRKPGEVLTPHEPRVVRNAVNHFLQKNEGDISLIDVRCVASDFHSRYKAQERIYFYRLLTGLEPLSIFEKERAWHVPKELDVLAIQKACKILVGHHDFSSFRSSGCQAKSPVKTLDELCITEVASQYFPSVVERELHSSFEQVQNLYSTNLEVEQTGSLKISTASYENNEMSCDGRGSEFGQRRRHRCFVITARARSFLYHQVRLLVGVLIAVGTGDLTVSDVERILNKKNVTSASPFIAPACGLYLANVKYDFN